MKPTLLCLAVLLCCLYLPVTVPAQGTVMIVGLDTEYGERPNNTTHGSIPTWVNIIGTGLLANVTNGKTDILVIGGGKWNGNMVKKFWTQVAQGLGRNVYFKHRDFWNSVASINAVNFNDYALVVVASNAPDNGLTGSIVQKELNALNARKEDILHFICNGGALFASTNLLPNAYDYISSVGTISPVASPTNDITPTAAGLSVGITATNLDIGPWHSGFSSYPGYLVPLALNTTDNKVMAIGGKNVSLTIPSFTLPKTEFCMGDAIIADGNASKGAATCFWSLQESDANWNRYGPEISNTFQGPPGIFSVSGMAAVHHLQLKCNTYYRLKLAVTGMCHDWKDTTALIKILCPKVSAGADICCTNYHDSFAIGMPATPGVSYSWTPATGLSNPNAAKPFVSVAAIQGLTPLTYVVSATDSKGCIARDTMRVFCGPPRFSISKQKRDCCSYLLTVTGTEIGDIKWSTGATSSTIEVSHTGIYTATVTNACGTATQQAAITAADTLMMGQLADIIAPDAFTPNGDGVNDYFQLIDFGPNAPSIGTGPAYNAYGYKLTIYDRWGIGHEVASLVKRCSGLVNGEIKWDGKFNGQLQPMGVYSFRLELWNCRFPDGHPPDLYQPKYVCTECGFGLFMFDCGFFKTCIKSELTNQKVWSGIGVVKLVL